MTDWEAVAARHDGALDEEPPSPAEQAEIDREAEAALVRARLFHDPFVSNADYGRLLEEAADADERRAWGAEREED